MLPSRDNSGTSSSPSPRLILRIPVEAVQGADGPEPLLTQVLQNIAASVTPQDSVHVYFPDEYVNAPSNALEAIVNRTLAAFGVPREQIVIRSLNERAAAIPFRQPDAPERIVIEVNELAA